MSIHLYSPLYLQLAVALLHWTCTITVPVTQPGIEAYENYFNEIYVEDENADAEMRNAVQTPAQYWPDRTIYYRISTDYTPEETDNVRHAVQVFEERTCLSFREYNETSHTGTKRYIYYKKSPDMCGTKVGYQPGFVGTHDVALNANCLAKVGVIQHETLHVLGLYHEHSRPDRNEYIRIEYTNIALKYWSQFMLYPHTTTFDVPYDYESLMHYPAFAFATDPTKPSMRAREGNSVIDRPMGQTNGPSEGDLTKINIMYKCDI